MEALIKSISLVGGQSALAKLLGVVPQVVHNWLVRGNAAESLARLKNNRAIDPLVLLLEDENEMVRDTVEGALSSLGWTPSSSK